MSGPELFKAVEHATRKRDDLALQTHQEDCAWLLDVRPLRDCSCGLNIARSLAIAEVAEASRVAVESFCKKPEGTTNEQ